MVWQNITFQSRVRRLRAVLTPTWDRVFDHTEEKSFIQTNSLERQCRLSKQVHRHEIAQEKRRNEMRGKTLRNRIVAAVVMGSFLTLTTACYGPFNLTRNVYHWNGNIKGGKEVNEKWMKEFVFFGMIIIPVYMFSALLDAFIFNS